VSADDGVTDGAATRLRLRESLSRRRSPRKIITIIAAVIATMFGSTAFAYYVGGWRPSWIEPPTPETPTVVVAEPAAAVEPKMPARTVRRDVDDDVEAIDAESLVESPAVAPPDIELPPIKPSNASESNSAVARAEQPRAEPPRAEPSTIEQPRVEQPATVDKPRIEPPRAEPPRAELPRVQQPSTVEPRVEPPRVEPPRVEPPATATTTGTATSTSRTGAPRTAPATPTSPTPDPELAAYRVAHEAHFRGTDPKAALAAWDAYLAKFPNGRLVLEARYDRALILIKLRRFSDARAALKPFAEGTYRRAEAIKLLAAIENR
jgi:hypothetical protein